MSNTLFLKDKRVNLGKLNIIIESKMDSYIANDGMNGVFANPTTNRQNIFDALYGEVQGAVFGLIYKFCRWII